MFKSANSQDENISKKTFTSRESHVCLIYESLWSDKIYDYRSRHNCTEIEKVVFKTVSMKLLSQE